MAKETGADLTFEQWVDKNQDAIREALDFIAKPEPLNGNQQAEILAKTTMYMALLNERMAEASGYYREALAMAYQAVLTDFKDAATTQQKAMAEGRASLQKRWYDSCERGSRTATHKIDALRSLLSYSKAEAFRG